MPLLPTETVTVPQLTKVLSCFGSDQASATAAYKIWLVKTVRAYVLESVRNQSAIDAQTAAHIAWATADSELPPEPPIGPMV